VSATAWPGLQGPTVAGENPDVFVLVEVADVNTLDQLVLG
jgi:hypothetical protein